MQGRIFKPLFLFIGKQALNKKCFPIFYGNTFVTDSVGYVNYYDYTSRVLSVVHVKYTYVDYVNYYDL